MRAFGRQLVALIRKNLLVCAARRPVGFVLSVYIVPLVVLGLLLAIPSLVPNHTPDGVSQPGPIRSLADTVDQKLVIVRPPQLGRDVDTVIDTFTRPVTDRKLIEQVADESGLLSMCLPNTRGVSDCHAIVIFRDSPLTTGPGNSSAKGHAWDYTIRLDPAQLSGRNVNIAQHKSAEEDVGLPLQLAINNAITNSTSVPDTVMFTREIFESEADKLAVTTAAIVGRIYVFALSFALLPIIYSLTSLIASERDAGVSQLIDAMGGGTAMVTRVFSWVITFDVVALPTYIGFGILYQRLVFQASSIATLIGWQIMLGFAVTSWTVLGASFFAKSRVSAVYVSAAFVIVAIAAQMYASESRPHPQPVSVRVLALLFPSANSVFFTQQMSLWQMAGLAADTGKFPPEVKGLWAGAYELTQGSMILFLALNVLLFTGAAIGIEKLRHGIHFRKRSFSPPGRERSGETRSASVVAQTRDIAKRFTPGLLTRICCCGRRKAVQAVDGVSFQARLGQILCLVGPNGSGKTTTLHMMAGFISPSAGSSAFEARPSQVGICPQRNVLWDELTVEEHVRLWDRIKAGNRSRLELDRLIEQCDLGPKRKTKAKQLSGGQKRKLQLACMFVGDSTVCLIDECTSGPDPLSRRAIWEILLAQRAHRSIIVTTHFLDEVDVLADDIVVLAQGRVKCQGSSAQLKNAHGGGYRVVAPWAAAEIFHGYPMTAHQDRIVYEVPDSQTAANMVATLDSLGMQDVSLSGPQFEDVFLNVLGGEGCGLGMDSYSLKAADTNGARPAFEMTPGRITSFMSQFAVLYGKRWRVFKRFWTPYFFAFFVPIAATFLMGTMLSDVKTPACDALADTSSDSAADYVPNWSASCPRVGSCMQLSLAPPAAKTTLFELVVEKFPLLHQVDPKTYDGFVVTHPSRDEMVEYIAENRTRAGFGGISMGSSGESPLLAYNAAIYGSSTASLLLDIWSQMQSGSEIRSSREAIPKSRQGGESGALAFVYFFCLLQVVYPVLFVLYPALEQARKVRALQYANGVRRAPLWVAYLTFDFFWIFLVAVCTTLILIARLPFNGPATIMFPILALYGLVATLMGYAVAHFAQGPLKAFVATLGSGMLNFTIVGIAIRVSDGAATTSQGDSMAGVTFGANLFFPIGNVFRALILGLNLMESGCENGERLSTGSMRSFGAPMLYLFLQVLALLLLVVWLEGGLPRLTRSKAVPKSLQDFEMSTMASESGGNNGGVGASPAGDGVRAEQARAEKTPSDPFRALHVKKTFGTNTAVDDVTFGLARGEVMALIGPNGAGKSTLVNMIQGELSPDRGEISLCQKDSRSPATKKSLGVCPQYDAPDMMSTRDHLFFYARIKGIRKPKHDVELLMDRLGLTPHAKTQAAKLSGGNKRKLMLAIALMGTPPVVVLDEPTSAMDALAKRAFWRTIQDISDERSVLLTTHSMEEADALASRTTILARRLLVVGTTAALRARYSNLYYVSLVLATAPTSTPEEMRRVGNWAQSRVAGVRFEREMLGGQVRFTFPADAPRAPGQASQVASLIQALEGEKGVLGVEFYSISGPTLENVFLSVVRENQVQEEDGVASGKGWRRWLGR